MLAVLITEDNKEEDHVVYEETGTINFINVTRINYYTSVADRVAYNGNKVIPQLKRFILEFGERRYFVGYSTDAAKAYIAREKMLKA